MEDKLTLALRIIAGIELSITTYAGVFIEGFKPDRGSMGVHEYLRVVDKQVKEAACAYVADYIRTSKGLV